MTLSSIAYIFSHMIFPNIIYSASSLRQIWSILESQERLSKCDSKKRIKIGLNAHFRPQLNFDLSHRALVWHSTGRDWDDPQLCWSMTLHMCDIELRVSKRIHNPTYWTEHMCDIELRGTHWILVEKLDTSPQDYERSMCHRGNWSSKDQNQM